VPNSMQSTTQSFFGRKRRAADASTMTVSTTAETTTGTVTGTATNGNETDGKKY
jgi:hypothetical protein